MTNINILCVQNSWLPIYETKGTLSCCVNVCSRPYALYTYTAYETI